ncbi:MAG: PH domain-containing protein [Pirellulaceae bacterium]
MKQAIAGVAPAELDEVTVMTVRPSVAMYGLGRWLGRLFAIKAGGYIFTIGNFIALASIPIALVLYFLRLLPYIGIRYKLTNRRVIVQRGLLATDDRWVDLDRFDRIEVVVQPGQAWYHAGDLVFRLGDTETFRLPGVSRPETFRHTCLNAQRVHVGVLKALERERAA